MRRFFFADPSQPQQVIALLLAKWEARSINSVFDRAQHGSYAKKIGRLRLRNTIEENIPPAKHIR